VRRGRAGPGAGEVCVVDPKEIERWEERARACGLSLERIEPDGRPRPRARWYAVHLQPTLLDGVDLVRQWGRIGTRTRRPQRRAEHFADLESALVALRRLLARRRTRGYVAPGVDGPPPSARAEE
jgi:predicted DNA-binding WGR domain protein